MNIIEDTKKGFKTLIPDEGKVLVMDGIVSHEVVMPVDGVVAWEEKDYVAQAD